MAAGVMLDTSFLITLAGRERAHFEAARRYWQHFVENEIPIFLDDRGFGILHQAGAAAGYVAGVLGLPIQLG